MADDNRRRSLRNEYTRTPLPAASANDPLAELARLIGQTDPFAEFGLKPQQSSTPAQHAAAAQSWAPQSGYPAQNYEHGHTAGPELFPSGQQHAAYAQVQHDAIGYDSNIYYQDEAPAAESYDDIPPSRRRIGLIAVAAVVMLAVVGTAGAVGYRVLFGSSGSVPPPVIKADTSPAKVVPPSKSEPQSNKLIYDRVGERGGTGSGEKIVSREEQPVEIKDAKPAQGNLFPTALGSANASVSTVSASPADQPKKVHTIVIRPDQTTDAMEPARATAAKPAPAPKPVAQAPSPPQPPAPKPVAPAPPQRLASAPTATADAEEGVPVSRPVATRPVAAPQRNSNAPLSLSPDAAPAAAVTSLARTASVPPPKRAAVAQPAAASGQYAVQVSSQRSEADAEAAFRSLQGKYPTQLGGRQPMIRRADLGSKGIYYRAMVGPFASSGDASTLCQSLKSAGASCLIQKN